MDQELKSVLAIWVEIFWFAVSTCNAEVTLNWKAEENVGQGTQEVVQINVAKVELVGVDVDIEADL